MSQRGVQDVVFISVRVLVLIEQSTAKAIRIDQGLFLKGAMKHTGHQWSLTHAVGQQHIRNSAMESQELSTYCLITMLVIAIIQQKRKMLCTRRCLDVTVMPTFLNKYHDWIWTSTVSGWQLVRSELLYMLCCCYCAIIRIQAQQNNKSEILLITQSSGPLHLNIHTSTAITEYHS